MSETLDRQASSPPAESKPVTPFNLMDTPGIQSLLQPAPSDGAWINEKKIRRLYLQASAQQWFAPQRINFSEDPEYDAETRRIWIKFMKIFYTLEKMGLATISHMLPKAVHRLKSDECAYYLSAQLYDESRHVFSIENYLRKLGDQPKYERYLHALSTAANYGVYRVENWLFSTLFSENFASSFLRRARAARIDPLGSDLCKYLLVDESRHLHFLHIVLPDIMDRLSLFGRGSIKMSQAFIMHFTERVSRRFDSDAAFIGLDRRALLEEVFENVEKAYESFGVTRNYLWFPRIARVQPAH